MASSIPTPVTASRLLWCADEVPALGAFFDGIEIRPDDVAGDTGQALHLEDTLGDDSGLLHLRDALWAHAHELRELLVRTHGFGRENDGMAGLVGTTLDRLVEIGVFLARHHGALKYASGLFTVHRWLIAQEGRGAKNSPPVNPPYAKPKRPSPAPNPRDYRTFAAWLRAATNERGLQKQLADYCEARPQNVTKWLTKSIPEPHYLRRVAQWAHVDLVDLLRLIYGAADNDDDFDRRRGTWPFTFDRARYDRLTDEQKREIQGAVLRLILEYEDQRGAALKSRARA